MFPRKTRVIRCAIVLTVCFTFFLLFVADFKSDHNELPYEHLDQFLLTANETDLWEVIATHRQRLLHDGVVSLPADLPLNSTAPQLREHIITLRKAIPINPHPFQVLLSPRKVCEGVDVYLLIYVHSAPGHFKQRVMIRESWANPRNFPDRVVRVIFLCGVVPDDKQVQDALMLEADTYGDILQEDFVDSYRNLTYKAIAGLRWINGHCVNARFVLKSDDDIFINIFNMVDQFDIKTKQEKSDKVSHYMICLVWSRMRVVREKKSKWYLSRAEFPDDYFPQYCSGSAFAMTTDVATAMYDASLRTPFFWVDDFYVTGLLAREVGVTRTPYNQAYSLGPSTFLKKFTEPNATQALTVGHVHNMKHLRQVWNRVLLERRPGMISPADIGKVR